jgi:hypothetical protein
MAQFAIEAEMRAHMKVRARISRSMSCRWARASRKLGLVVWLTRRRNSPENVTIDLAIGGDRQGLEPVERIVALGRIAHRLQSSAQRDSA